MHTHSKVASQQRIPIMPLLLGIVGVVAIGSSILYAESRARVSQLVEDAEEAASRNRTTLSDKDLRIVTLEAELASTSALLAESEEARENYKRRFNDKEDEVNDLSSQVKKISGTVGVLDKLAKTDKELLMKYSKVYFLNEHYIPQKLGKIDAKYSAVSTDQYIEGRVLSHLEDMIEDAKRDGAEIKVRSAYRSFESQKNLKSAYSVSYGSGANTFSADQGFSEHQLGTTVDLTSPENSNQLAGFDSTNAFLWLQKNAHKYGFVLSYPKGNAYYVYEPWHWRYVGEDLASDLHDDTKSFYDLDQREIDKYLVKVFD
jgi:zinc D-Ala-D-Ala carboxypeptidase